MPSHTGRPMCSSLVERNAFLEPSVTVPVIQSISIKYRARSWVKRPPTHVHIPITQSIAPYHQAIWCSWCECPHCP